MVCKEDCQKDDAHRISSEDYRLANAISGVDRPEMTGESSLEQVKYGVNGEYSTYCS
jgi:hypothetical protein